MGIQRFQPEFGGQYIDDKFHQEGANTFANGVFASLRATAHRRAELVALIGRFRSAFGRTIGTSGFIPGYDNGALAPGIVIYDPYAIYNALEAAGHKTTPGFDPGSVLNVQEKTLSLFMKANFDTDIAGMPFHFSAGLREESTHVTVSAIGQTIRSDGRSRMTRP